MHKGWNCGDFFDEGITNGAGWYSLSKGKVSVGDIGPYQTDVYQLRQCIFVMTLKMACMIQCVTLLVDGGLTGRGYIEGNHSLFVVGRKMYI